MINIVWENSVEVTVSPTYIVLCGYKTKPLLSPVLNDFLTSKYFILSSWNKFTFFKFAPGKGPPANANNEKISILSYTK